MNVFWLDMVLLAAIALWTLGVITRLLFNSDKEDNPEDNSDE